MKLVGVNNYRKQIKRLYFGRNWNKARKQDTTEYSNRRQSVFSAMSNRCWRLANEFTNFTARTKADVIADTISR